MIRSLGYFHLKPFRALAIRARISISREAWIYPTLILAISAFGGWISWFMPLGRDQGNYAYAGWALNSGLGLYKDVLAFKPPMTVYVHSLSQVMFGHHAWSIRMLDWAIIAVIAIILYMIIRELEFTPWIATMGAIFYLLQYWGYDYWHSAQTDHWAQFPIVLCVLLLIKKDALTLTRWIFSGFFGMISILFKYTFLFVWAPIVIYSLLNMVGHGDPRRLRRISTASACVILGAVLAFLVFMWPMLFSKETWAAFVDIQANMVAPYSKQNIFHSLPSLITTLFETLFGLSSLRPTGVLLAIAFLVLLFIKQSTTVDQYHPVLLLTFLWIGCGMFACLLQTKFFIYHYAPLLPPVAILGAVALDRLTLYSQAYLSIHKPWLIAAGCVIAWLLFLGTGIDRNVNYALDALANPDLPASRSRLIHASQRDYSLLDIEILAGVLSETTQEGDRVFIWGYDPTVNFLAMRFSPTRFIYNFPFRLDPRNPAWTHELLEDLAAKSPAKVVIAYGDDTPHVTGNRIDSLQLLAYMPALSHHLAKYYEIEGHVGTHYIVGHEKASSRLRAAELAKPGQHCPLISHAA